jgi:hypothetical protein
MIRPEGAIAHRGTAGRAVLLFEAQRAYAPPSAHPERGR